MPARLRDLRRALVLFGISVEEPPSGSHWKLRDASGKMFPLSCHNGEKSVISDIYLKALCRNFSIDFDEFRRRL